MMVMACAPWITCMMAFSLINFWKTVSSLCSTVQSFFAVTAQILVFTSSRLLPNIFENVLLVNISDSLTE